MTETFDAIVIGAGQAGGPLAAEFARAGRKTALVEREHVGGTCINVGCTPTKTMVASARVAYLARRAKDFGVSSREVAVDQTKVRERKRSMVESFRGGGQRRLERTENLSLVFGEARFAGAGLLEVRTKDGFLRSLAAETIVINTGCRPARPELPGLEQVPWLDSTSVMELGSVPEHLLVVGGGYIGLEFGQMFRRFGSRVTIVQRGPQLLAKQDPDVAKAVAEVLRGDGIEILLNTAATKVGKEPGGRVALSVRGPDRETTLFGTHLLVAAGRTPNTETLHAETGGVELDSRGYVRVNDRLETGARGIYAAGDVTGGPAFTHASYDDFRILRENLLRGGSATTRNRLMPWTVFIDPELAHVGLTEREAGAAGRNLRVARMPMSWVARALEMDEPRGFMKALVDRDTDEILGFTVLGVAGGELMAVVEMAMLGRVPSSVLRDAVFVHPTLAESLNNLFATLG